MTDAPKMYTMTFAHIAAVNSAAGEAFTDAAWSLNGGEGVLPRLDADLLKKRGLLLGEAASFVEAHLQSGDAPSEPACFHCRRAGSEHDPHGYCPDSPPGEDAVGYEPETLERLRAQVDRLLKERSERLLAEPLNLEGFGDAPSDPENVRLDYWLEQLRLARDYAPDGREHIEHSVLNEMREWDAARASTEPEKPRCTCPKKRDMDWKPDALCPVHGREA